MIACIKSLMYGADASVTSIGRGIQTNAYEKHNIKRADRLLSNQRLLSELPLIYKALCQWLGLISSEPIIHVDWSDLDPNKRHFLIRASLLFSGRSLTLYQEVHDLGSKEKPATHKVFLGTLAQMLGQDIKPTIVTDAGFKVPWFRQVLNLGWNYVGRVRKPNFYRVQGVEWRCISHLYQLASPTPKVLEGQLCRSNTLATNLVLFKDRMKGRVSLGCAGQRRMNSNDRKYSKSAKDPWLLATSLSSTSTLAKRVVNIYSSRMQIEEAFRDMKSQQFGLGYMVNKSKKLPRVSILVMLVSLANFILVMIGLSLDTSGKTKHFQANTVRYKRVLSFHTLGIRAVRNRRFKVTVRQWKNTLDRLSEYIQGADYDVI
ncbi:IS4 family transposase [Thalassotalea fusca]